VSEAVQDSAVGRPVFSPLVALAMVGVGALSLLFYLVFAAYAPDLSGDYDGRANALSRSAVGFAALSAFLRDQDIPVLMSRGLGEQEMAKASLIILTPGVENSGKETLAVTTKEPKLVILPKWRAAPDPLHPGWVQNAGLLPLRKAARRRGCITASTALSSPPARLNPGRRFPGPIGPDTSPTLRTVPLSRG